jgi:hypothetical protein
MLTSPLSVNNRIENVGASTSHKPMGLHDLLQGYLYLFRAAEHQLRQDKHQDMRQKKQKLTSAS